MTDLEPAALKSCPFCGHRATLQYDDERRWRQVVCDGCGAKSPEHPSEDDRTIAAWNRRALASPAAISGEGSGAVEPEAKRLKRRIDYRLNDALCEMKPDYDDSITGFNEAWDIVSRILNEEIALATAPEGSGGAE